MKQNKVVKKILSMLLMCLVIFPMLYDSTLVSKASTYYNAQLEISSFEKNIQEEGVEFADKVAGLSDLTSGKLEKVYDTYSNPLGYCVSIYNKGLPYGFVIIDPRCQQGLVEYAVNQGIVSPFDTICAKNNLSIDEDESIHYVIDNNFSNYVVDNASSKVYSSEKCYNILDFNQNIMNNTLTSSAKQISSWSDIIKSGITFDYDTYSIESWNSLPNFYVLTESSTEQQTSHFACCASSMYICAALLSRVNSNEFYEDYMALWDYSDTSVESVENGVTYGTTLNSNIGPALVSFLRAKGVDDASYEFQSNPDFSFFTNAVDNSKVSIVCTQINTSSGKEGHAIAVEGYTYFKNNNDGSTMRVLNVADTWNSYLCYYNYDYPVLHRDGVCIDGTSVVSPY